MDVIAHRPHAWFLMEDEGDLYLDINCDHGAVGFSMLLRLTPEEALEVRGGSDSAVDRLATRFQNQAIAVFLTRNLSAPWQQKAGSAIERWKSQHQA